MSASDAALTGHTRYHTAGRTGVGNDTGDNDDIQRARGAARRVTRRSLLVGASAVATARLLTGSTSLASSDEPVLDLDQPASVSRAGVTRGKQFQIMPPPLRPQPRWRPGQFVTHVDIEGRRMALTFDDGPSPYNTPSVLATLAQFGVKATFFLVGVNVQSFPALARRIVDEGHEIGNHSVYHSPYRSVPLASQIGPNQSIIRNATGVTPVVHRAPGLTTGGAILSACSSLGLYEAHTHMSTFDYLSPRRSASQLINEFVRYHRNGALPIYHDGGNRRPTPAAVPGIISYGLSVGYTFVTATELVSSGRPQPFSGSYATAATLGDYSLPESGYVDVCRYDAAGELKGMLERDDLRLTTADRSRIVGALADIDDLSRD
jgi:peptidoglycan-N-acetylglucosamine deacetylase